MTTMIFDISMSLDGFVTASGVRPEELLGDGGQRLHPWACLRGFPMSNAHETQHVFGVRPLSWRSA